MSDRVYRVGGSWYGKGGLCTVIESRASEPAGSFGRRPSDRLVAMVDSPELALLIVRALNAHLSADTS